MPTFKRYIVSSLTTFGSTFLLVVCVAVSADSFTFSKATIVSLFVSALFTAVRAAAKGIVELSTGLTGDAIAPTNTVL